MGESESGKVWEREQDSDGKGERESGEDRVGERALERERERWTGERGRDGESECGRKSGGRGPERAG